MTKEEFLKEIDGLDDEYFQKRWELLAEKYGKEHPIKTYKNIEGLKEHILKNYKKNIANEVEGDCKRIRLYSEILKKVGREEFVESFGEFKLLLLEKAIKKQKEGLFGYILRV